MIELHRRRSSRDFVAEQDHRGPLLQKIIEAFHYGRGSMQDFAAEEDYFGPSS